MGRNYWQLVNGPVPQKHIDNEFYATVVDFDTSSNSNHNTSSYPWLGSTSRDTAKNSKRLELLSLTQVGFLALMSELER